MMNSLAEEAESAAKKNDTGTLYKITKQLCNKRKQTHTGVRDKNCKLLTEEHPILQRWKELFEEVLNVENQLDTDENENLFDFSNIEVIERINNTGPFTEEEVKLAIKKLKSGKSFSVLIRSVMKTYTSEVKHQQ